MLTRTAEKPEQRVERVVKHESSPFLWGALGIFLICYVAIASVSASVVPLWMDEVLTVWTIRLPSVALIYDALVRGAEFSPPGWVVFLHVYSEIAGDSLLALRLPSIAAVVLAGICSFLLMRRYLGDARAAFGFCLVLDGLYGFAVQVRPYAGVVACFALALLFWDGLNRDESWWRSAVIGILLALAISLHFYAVLLVPCLGLIELANCYYIRRFRVALWCALTAAGASIFVWRPLMRMMSGYCANDSSGGAYYAQPTLGRFTAAICNLFLEGHVNILLLLIAMIIIVVGRFLGQDDTPSEQGERRYQRAGLWPIIFGLVLLPVIVFLFSLIVTKTFNERYLVATVIGTSALIASCLPATPFFRRMAPFLILLAALVTSDNLETDKPKLEFAAKVPGPYPIVVADGLQFFSLMESAAPEIRDRLVYLTLPPETYIGDATNMHAIERWKAINPKLPVENIDQFVAENPKFYVVDRQTSDDAPTPYLIGRGRIELTDKVAGTLVFQSRPLAAVAGK